jgi:hypothetical protein
MLEALKRQKRKEAEELQSMTEIGKGQHYEKLIQAVLVAQIQVIIKNRRAFKNS